MLIDPKEMIYMNNGASTTHKFTHISITST